MRIIILIVLCGLIGFSSSLRAQSGFEYPIILSAPYHLDTIDNKRPTLIWQCDLATIVTDPRVDMQLVLVEKNHGQSISEALIMNTVLYSGYGLKDANFPFPSSMEDLLPGHTYAWQINIMMNGSLVIQSEQWEFSIRDPREKEGQYIKLATNLNNTIYKISSDKIYFVIEDKGESIKRCSIRKASNGNGIFTVDGLKKTNSNRDYGYYQADIENLKLQEGYYVFEVFVENKKYMIQFYYVK